MPCDDGIIACAGLHVYDEVHNAFMEGRLMSQTADYNDLLPGEHVRVGDAVWHVLRDGPQQVQHLTVILEAGLGAFSLMWWHVQQALSAHTLTLSYDRAGMGWSDAPHTARNPAHITEELHNLLGVLGIAPPYVLVGHSLGGSIGRYFAHQYRDEVAGLVMVDASHPMQFEPLRGYDRTLRITRLGLRLMAGLSHWGALGRWMVKRSYADFGATLPPQVWQEYIFAASQPGMYATINAELAAFDSFFGAQHVLPVDLGDLPLRVVTAGESMQRGQGGVSAAELNQFHHKSQADLAQLSTQGQQIVVAGASHLSIVTQPIYADQVAEIVLQLLG